MRKLLLLLLILLNYSYVHAQLSGSYTIDPSGGGATNFTSFTEAVDTLISQGVSGPVVFNVADGNYYEQISIPEITGASALNTITFRSASMDSSKVNLFQYESTSESNAYTIRLDGADYITFSQLRIRCQNVPFKYREYGRVIEIQGGANHNKFLNNLIEGGSLSGNSFNKAAVYSDSSLDHNNLFSQNRIKYAHFGFYFNGDSLYGFESGTVIENNIFTDVTNIANLLYQTSLTVNFNKAISNQFGTTATGIRLLFCEDSLSIYNNYLIVDHVGLSVYFCKDSSSIASNIFNNIIIANGVYTNSKGIELESSVNFNIFFNSVNIPAIHNYFKVGYALFIKGGSGNTLLNNNLAVTGPKGYALYVSSGALDTSNNNNLFTTDSVLAYYNGNIENLTDWEQVTGFDDNSISKNPLFVSTTNLQPISLHLNASAKSISRIPSDYNGSTRDALYPDIGAIEFMPLAENLAAISIISPLYDECGDSNAFVGAVIHNRGTVSLSNFNLNFDFNGSSLASETYSKILASDAIDTFFFSKTINSYSGGDYYLTVFSDLSADSFHSDDTASIQLSIGGLQDINVTHDTVCHAGQMNLKATTAQNDLIVWYSDSLGGTSIDTGSIFTTPVLAHTKKYFAEALTFNSYKGGPGDIVIDPSTGTFWSPSGVRITYFDVFEKIVIDSIGVYADGASTVEIYLTTPSGKILDTAIGSVKGTNNKEFIKTNFTVPPGNYGLRTGPKTTGFLFLANKGNWPYITPGLMSVTGSYVGMSYYYFYDIRFSVSVCSAPRKAVLAVVHHTKNAELTKGNQFNGIINSGTTTAPDEICAYKASSYELIPPNSYQTEEYQVKWTIDSFSISTTNGTLFNDTTITLPDTAHSWQLTVNPGPDFVDSTFRIYMVVRDMETGCDTTIEHYLKILPSPVAKFSFENDCQGTAISFSDSSIVNGATPVYSWDFGDGNSSSLQNPTHTYDSAGTYNVSLRLSYPSGCSDSLVKTITIYPKPKADFSSGLSCAGQVVSVDNLSEISSGSIVKYEWAFGDGTTDTSSNPTHIYDTAGTYTLKLTAISDQGCIDTVSKVVVTNPTPQAAFTVNESCEGKQVLLINSSNSSETLTYTWDFGDGTTSTDKEPLKMYDTAGQYKIKLKVTTISGCSDSVTNTVEINPTPKVDFTASIACAGREVWFNGSLASGSPAISSYYWDFGDGVTDTVLSPSHIYVNTGAYDVKFKVLSDKGCTDSIVKPVTIHNNLSVDFQAKDGCSGESISLSNSSASDDSLSYHWDFGDGTASTDKTPLKVYNSAGQYDITLIATTPYGCKDSLKQRISIEAFPKSEFSLLENICVNKPIKVSNTSSGNITSYHWNFGDGQTAAVKDPFHFYTQKGGYEVTLTTTSVNSCQDIFKDSVFVFQNAVADFYSPFSTCPGEQVSFINNSSHEDGDSLNLYWEFGDGKTSTDINPQHIFPSGKDTFIIKLTVVTAAGCTTSASKYLHMATPKPSFSVSSTCRNEFQITNTSSIHTGQITSWLWDFGDGKSDTTESPMHIYDNEGDYTITLTAISDKGCSASFSDSFRVNPTPNADFDVANICAEERISTRSADTVNIISHYWQCNGTEGTEADFEVILNEPGTYAITHIATSKDGCTDSSTKTLEVYPKPNAEFTSEVQTDRTVQLSAKDTSSTVYEWDFGNGDLVKGGAQLEHRYISSGKYMIGLKVTNVYGCITEHFQAINVECESNGNSEWKVYPNPAEDEFIMINGPDCEVISEVHFVDMIGKTSLREVINSDQEIKMILPAELSVGLYNVMIVTQSGDVISKKVLIK